MRSVGQAVARFQADLFDLILMDIEMPGMNGFETTTRIRALEGNEPWAWTPIIFVTATDTPTNVVTAIEAGGDDFISKMAPEGVLQAKMKAMSRIAACVCGWPCQRKLQDQANRDGLTGLFNPALWICRLTVLGSGASNRASRLVVDD